MHVLESCRPSALLAETQIRDLLLGDATPCPLGPGATRLKQDPRARRCFPLCPHLCVGPCLRQRMELKPKTQRIALEKKTHNDMRKPHRLPR